MGNPRAFHHASAFAAIALLSGPVWAANSTYIPRTPSGTAEALFAEPPSEVIGKLAGHCMDRAYPVVSQTEATLVCQTPPDGELVSVLSLIGPRQAAYQGFLRFNVVRVANGTRAQVSGYTEQRNAFGQLQSFPDKDGYYSQSFLIDAGGSYPKGTTFEGFDLGAIGTFSQDGFTLETINPDGAAQAAGLTAGDTILKLNGRRFYHGAEFRALYTKAGRSGTITATIQRAGVKSIVTIPLRVRPSEK